MEMQSALTECPSRKLIAALLQPNGWVYFNNTHTRLNLGNTFRSTVTGNTDIFNHTAGELQLQTLISPRLRY